MALYNFPWLPQAENEAENALKAVADSGYHKVPYEYGLRLYREQKDIKLAIYYLSEAARQGYTKAEYRLGRILLDSPWVTKDEKKALFWLESAADKSYVFAKQKIAEIKLLTKDESLKDIEGAIVYLRDIELKQRQNPEFLFLEAIANASRKERNFRLAVDKLREAIDAGSALNWDVRAWEAQIARWTSGGRVTVTDKG